MFKRRAIRYGVVACGALLVACGSSESDIAGIESPSAGALAPTPTLPAPAPAASVAGGIWRGSDSEGHEYLLFDVQGVDRQITDLTLGYAGLDGCCKYYDDDGQFISDKGYWALPPVTDMSSYGWSLCILDTNSWAYGQSILGRLHCSQMPDGDWVREIELAFDPRFDLGADLSFLAGHWTDADNPGADVASFDVSGQLTGQSAATGCVYLGQLSVVDGRYNVYHVTWTFANCTGEQVALNGVSFTGLAMLDSIEEPTELTVVATGFTKAAPYEENGRGIAFVAEYLKY